MPADWNSFLNALSVRGVSFADIAEATDRKSLIQSIGITNPLDIAIIETHWSKNQRQQQQQQQNDPTTKSSSHNTNNTSHNKHHQNQNTMTMMMTNNNSNPSSSSSSLRNQPEELQDMILTEELSFALRGISGSLIRFDNNNNNNNNNNNSKTSPIIMKPTINIASSIPTSTAQMILKALQNAQALFSLEPICRHEYAGRSLIRGAVGEAVREVCAAYVRCIGDMFCTVKKNTTTGAGNNISLSRLCTEVEGIGYPIRRLSSLFISLNERSSSSSTDQQQQPPQAQDGGGLTGPWLLNAIHLEYNRCIGNPDDEKIIGLLLRRAARPYFRILFDWMHRGDLKNDPFNEFFVIDTEQQQQLKQKPTSASARNSARLSGGRSALDTSSSASDVGDLDDDEENRQNTNIPLGVDGAPPHQQTNVASDRDAIDRWEHRFELVPRQVPHFLAVNRVYRQVHVCGKYCNMISEFTASSSSSTSSLSHEDAAPTGVVPSLAATVAAENNHNNNNNSSKTDFAFLSITEDELFEWGDFSKLERSVHRAHTTASTNVLQMLVTQHRLLDRLKSLRLYFFLAHGDWLVNFLDTANRLLQRPASEVKKYSLNSLLQSSIAKSCSSREDPCHSFTSCSLSDVSLFQAIELTRRRDPTFTNVYRGHFHQHHRNGISSSFPHQHLCFELLQLEVVSEWPLSLILNDIFITKLNFAFRLLLRCKICERALNSVIRHQHNSTKNSHNNNNNNNRKRFFNNNDDEQEEVLEEDQEQQEEKENPFNSGIAVSLRSQLLQFVRQFQFYAAHEVLEPAWETFMQKVAKAPGINHIGTASAELCQTMLRGLALTSEHGFRILWRILEMTLSFAQLVMQYQQYQIQLQQQGGGTADFRSTSSTDDLTNTNNNNNNNIHDLNRHLSPKAIRQQIQDWLKELYQLLTELADPTRPDSANLLQLLVWLDFNGFYEKMGVYKVRHAAVRNARREDDEDEGDDENRPAQPPRP